MLCNARTGLHALHWTQLLPDCLYAMLCNARTAIHEEHWSQGCYLRALREGLSEGLVVRQGDDPHQHEDEHDDQLEAGR